MNIKGNLKLNRKGFTLIELLATVILLALIGGIATYSIINTITVSKLKSEKIFVDKLSKLIDDYIDLKPPTKTKNTTIYQLTKCNNNNCTETRTVEAIKMFKSNGEKIYLSDLVAENLVTYDELVNPKNKKKCFEDTNPEIKIYKDSDYVYYYFVNLKGTRTNCSIGNENGIISTLTDELYTQLNN